MDEVITAADASSSTRTMGTSPPSIPSNLPLLSSFLAFAIAQFLKLFTTWYKEKRWDSRRLVGSGGMPSSHSATVTALAVAIGFHDRTQGSTFALAVILAAVVIDELYSHEPKDIQGRTRTPSGKLAINVELTVMYVVSGLQGQIKGFTTKTLKLDDLNYFDGGFALLNRAATMFTAW